MAHIKEYRNGVWQIVADEHDWPGGWIYFNFIGSRDDLIAHGLLEIVDEDYIT